MIERAAGIKFSRPIFSRPISLGELMEDFLATLFLGLGDTLCRYRLYLSDHEEWKAKYKKDYEQLVGPMDEKYRNTARAVYDDALEYCEKYHLPASTATIRKILKTLSSNYSKVTDLYAYSEELYGRLYDELKERRCLILGMSEASIFENPLKDWDRVLEKFPNLTEDIAESSYCRAFQRTTAAVFHLMRIMEVGTQEFGKKLGVIFPTEKVWQVILQESDKSIRGMDQKAEMTKKYAAISAHLYNVKLAWRNEVMHPKATYTPREAEVIADAVQVFMTDLVAVL
jgi:hypothetical protein